MAGKRGLAFSFLDEEEETSRKGRRLLKKRSWAPIVLTAVLFLPHRVASSTLSPPFYSVGSKRFRARFFAKRCLYIYIYIRAGKRWPATGWTVIRIGQRQQYPNSKTDGGRLEGTANTRTVAGSMKGTRIAATVIKESDRVNVIHLH